MGAGVRDAFPPPMCCIDYLRVSFGWIACGRLVSFGQIARGWLVAFGWIKRGRLALSLRYSAHMPLRIPLFMLFISAAFIFSMDSDEGIQKNGIFVPSL